MMKAEEGATVAVGLPPGLAEECPQLAEWASLLQFALPHADPAVGIEALGGQPGGAAFANVQPTGLRCAAYRAPDGSKAWELWSPHWAGGQTCDAEEGVLWCLLWGLRQHVGSQDIEVVVVVDGSRFAARYLAPGLLLSVAEAGDANPDATATLRSFAAAAGAEPFHPALLSDFRPEDGWGASCHTPLVVPLRRLADVTGPLVPEVWGRLYAGPNRVARDRPKAFRAVVEGFGAEGAVDDLKLTVLKATAGRVPGEVAAELFTRVLARHLFDAATRAIISALTASGAVSVMPSSVPAMPASVKIADADSRAPVIMHLPGDCGGAYCSVCGVRQRLGLPLPHDQKRGIAADAQVDAYIREEAARRIRDDMSLDANVTLARFATRKVVALMAGPAALVTSMDQPLWGLRGTPDADRAGPWVPVALVVACDGIILGAAVADTIREAAELIVAGGCAVLHPLGEDGTLRDVPRGGERYSSLDGAGLPLTLLAKVRALTAPGKAGGAGAGADETAEGGASWE